MKGVARLRKELQQARRRLQRLQEAGRLRSDEPTERLGRLLDEAVELANSIDEREVPFD